MLNFPLTRTRLDSQLVKIAALVCNNPDLCTTGAVSKETGFSYSNAASCLTYLRWADWDVELAATKKSLESSISHTGAKLRKAGTSNEREELSERLKIYQKRLEDLISYRDAMQADL